MAAVNNTRRSSGSSLAPKITVTNTDQHTTNNCNGKAGGGGGGAHEPKSPDTLSSLAPKKSLSSMSDEEIIKENLTELLEMKSREERKANGRLVAVIVAFLVIFLAIYHGWLRKTTALAGMLVPAGIMLSYGAWVVILAKRDKHKRAMFQRHIEEVALKNKCELEEKHARLRHGHSSTYTDMDQQSGSGSASSSLQYVNELLPKKQRQRRHRQRQRERKQQQSGDTSSGEVTVHRSSGAKRPSFRQKLFGQTIAHVKLVEMQADSLDSNSNDTTNDLEVERKPMPQVVRMSSKP